MAQSLAPTKLELLITIIDKNKAEFYADLIQSFDVNLQLFTLAKGTAGTDMMNYLGLSDSEKVVLFSVVREDRLEAITETLSEKFKSIRGGSGIAVSIPFTSMIGTLVYGFLSNEKEMVKGDAQ